MLLIIQSIVSFPNNNHIKHATIITIILMQKIIFQLQPILTKLRIT